MPDLDICDGDGRLVWQGIANTFAAMYFPAPPDRQMRGACAAGFQAPITAGFEKAFPGSGVMTPALVLLAADRPDGAALERRWCQGDMAGTVLWLRLAGLSVRRAVWLMDDQAGSRQGRRSRIYEVWTLFRPVAHLWAAFRHRGYKIKTTAALDDPQTWWSGDGAEDFTNFIIEAELFLRYSPPELFENSDVWRAPESFHRHIPEGFRVAAPLLTDDLVARVHRLYRH